MPGRTTASSTSAPIRLDVRSAEVMTSTYKDIPRISIGLSCARGAEIPTTARLRTPATPARRAGTVVVMIEIHELTKTYGSTTAVSDLTFTVRPGVVTGFLGPNGAGQEHDDADDPRPGRADQRLGSGQRPSAAGATPRRCTRSAGCSTRGPCTPPAAPTTTCSRSPRPQASASPASTRSSTRSASQRFAGGGLASSRSA